MKESGSVFYLLRHALILIFLISITACEKEEYDLLDRETAGVWSRFNTNSGLPANQILDIQRDASGNLWVAFAGNGVGMYQDGDWSFFNTSNSPIRSNSVTSLASTSDGGMIIGTTDGVSFRSSSGDWSYYTDPAVTTLSVNSINVLSDGTYWIGTENEGFYVDLGSGFFQVYEADYKNVNVIEEDNKGNVFLGTDNGLLKFDGSEFSLYTVSEGLPDNDITALFLDSKNRLWIGTNGGATVAYIDPTGRINNLSLMNGDLGTFVTDIFEDRRGHIWFATWYDGLIEYDGVVPHSYKIYNGFYENDINCIGEDKSGNMWFGLYSKGLLKYTLPIE
ncbi:MAG TPA: two-component regulator propeller domain-containing protein [Bacteroidales bacterium]|nr:two-component regulator propeller domain-containing protein [Bacteroidales bacterium]HPJ60902.1 two-component regulator propeller domain-containing protein [Bacteroidales bacterium]HPR13262.1 two-component regulator propeller domain-containing protein [Bacteroidales bacterium]HRW84947.1 two-component regulator propeller domain-containing protein [Bacteroidales bacterium]